MKKPSFIQRLTGSNADQYDTFDHFDQQEPIFDGGVDQQTAPRAPMRAANTWEQSEDTDGELAVDVYQTPDVIVVKALIAGVQPNTIDITLTREMVTISGSRADEREVDEEGYFQRELYWGAFSRTIILPEEIDVDTAEATEKHGVLTIRLPKINKKRQAKIKVRTR